jgi:hypothetical protein
MIGICLTCGHVDDLEAHHVAGRRNQATLTVPVCTDCHRILSAWQLSAGIELGENAGRYQGDATRALVVGVAHLLRLFAQRHTERSWLEPALVTHAARAASLLLDTLAPADRPGRWLPDPTVPPREATPVAWPNELEAQWLADWVYLLEAISEELNEDCPIPAEVLADALADPCRFLDAFQNAFGTEDAIQLLLGPLTEHAAAAQQVVLGFLSNPQLTLDQRLLDDAWLAVETGRRLIAEILNGLRGADIR